MEEWFQDWFDDDYAELYAHRDAEEAAVGVETALAAAPELAFGPVLDLGCGGGRHLEVLRCRNPEAFGLDLSLSLLCQAGSNLKPWLLQADMRRLPVKRGSLSGICLWFTPFGYFGHEENRKLLMALSACLVPGGVLWMDYLNAPVVRAALCPEPEILERGGLHATIRRSLEGDRVVKRLRIVRSATGEVRDVMESVQLYDPKDLVRLATEAGFHFRHCLGGYDGGEYRLSSDRWIGVFVKTAATMKD